MHLRVILVPAAQEFVPLQDFLPPLEAPVTAITVAAPTLHDARTAAQAVLYPTLAQVTWRAPSGTERDISV